MTADEVRQLVSAWRADATARRQRAPSDPAAEVLDSCAAELQEKFAAVSVEPLTPEEFGVLRGGVTAQTVTSWCRKGWLEAYRDDAGHWRIPRSAKLHRPVAA